MCDESAVGGRLWVVGCGCVGREWVVGCGCVRRGSKSRCGGCPSVVCARVVIRCAAGQTHREGSPRACRGRTTFHRRRGAPVWPPPAPTSPPCRSGNARPTQEAAVQSSYLARRWTAAAVVARQMVKEWRQQPQQGPTPASFAPLQSARTDATTHHSRSAPGSARRRPPRRGPTATRRTRHPARGPPCQGACELRQAQAADVERPRAHAPSRA